MAQNNNPVNQDDDPVGNSSHVTSNDNDEHDFYTADLRQGDNPVPASPDQMNDDTTPEMHDNEDTAPGDESVETMIEPDNPDGENTTTDTTRFTDEGGVVNRSYQLNPNSDNVNADNSVPPGTDEDTE